MPPPMPRLRVRTLLTKSCPPLSTLIQPRAVLIVLVLPLQTISVVSPTACTKEACERKAIEERKKVVGRMIRGIS